MYVEKGSLATITCDKCGTSDRHRGPNAGDAFFTLGWTANFRAKKYVHICYNCQSKKMKKTTDWVLRNFPVKSLMEKNNVAKT